MIITKRLPLVVFMLFFFYSLTTLSASDKKKEYYELGYWDVKTNELSVGRMKLSGHLELECGMYDNQALYASFGLERQLFKCTKIVFPISLKYGHMMIRIEYAPLYDSIKSVNISKTIYYQADKQGHFIQGNNPYFDWYKNLGTRVYYLGEFSLLQAYVSYTFNSHHQLIAGRLINAVGLSDHDIPWSDDGYFSPFSYWLTQDLLSGIVYRYSSKYVTNRVGILSGNNPMKGYANYLDHIQSPNIKANNTISYTANMSFNFGHFFSLENDSKIKIGALLNTMNSTWMDDLDDGKRRNTSYTVALLINLPIRDDLSFDIFSQYTYYLSGLKTDSVQYKASSAYVHLFKNIIQDGYYAGLSMRYKSLLMTYTHEVFDRFDYNIYRHWIENPDAFSETSLQQLRDQHQFSDIVNIRYYFTSKTALQLNYHYIKNPQLWVSSITNKHPSYRLSVSYLISF